MLGRHDCFSLHNLRNIRMHDTLLASYLFIYFVHPYILYIIVTPPKILQSSQQFFHIYVMKHLLDAVRSLDGLSSVYDRRIRSIGCRVNGTNV